MPQLILYPLTPKSTAVPQAPHVHLQLLVILEETCGLAQKEVKINPRELWDAVRKPGY